MDEKISGITFIRHLSFSNQFISGLLYLYCKLKIANPALIFNKERLNFIITIANYTAKKTVSDFQHLLFHMGGKIGTKGTFQAQLRFCDRVFLAHVTLHSPKILYRAG